MLGYQDRSGTYLPPYNWFAESAAKNIVNEVNKFYLGTGFQFKLQEVSRGGICAQGGRISAAAMLCSHESSATGVCPLHKVSCECVDALHNIIRQMWCCCGMVASCWLTAPCPQHVCRSAVSQLLCSVLPDSARCVGTLASTLTSIVVTCWAGKTAAKTVGTTYPADIICRVGPLIFGWQGLLRVPLNALLLPFYARWVRMD